MRSRVVCTLGRRTTAAGMARGSDAAAEKGLYTPMGYRGFFTVSNREHPRHGASSAGRVREVRCGRAADLHSRQPFGTAPSAVLGARRGVRLAQANSRRLRRVLHHSRPETKNDRLSVCRGTSGLPARAAPQLDVYKPPWTREPPSLLLGRPFLPPEPPALPRFRAPELSPPTTALQVPPQWHCMRGLPLAR